MACEGSCIRRDTNSRCIFSADSGLLAAVIGIYVATLSGKKLSTLRQQYTRYAAIPETNFVVEDKEAALQRIATAFAGKPQNPLDGLTVTLSDSQWFNVRPSNTESVMRLNAEAKTQAELDALVAFLETRKRPLRPRDQATDTASFSTSGSK